MGICQLSKYFYADVGELGWSFYLSAFLRHKKSIGDKSIVMTYPGRMALYRNVCECIPLQENYHKIFGTYSADGFGLYDKSKKRIDLRTYFTLVTPEGYTLYPDLKFRCDSFWNGNTIFSSYEVKEIKKERTILVFPRCRMDVPYNTRNLPEPFYHKLIKTLALEFPNLIVVSMGELESSYNITCPGIMSNYLNEVCAGSDLQNVIDRCANSVVTIGSQSALAKLSLLQGVPTYIIGHSEERHTYHDNWMKTRVAFHRIDKNAYPTFASEECLKHILCFTRSCL